MSRFIPILNGFGALNEIIGVWGRNIAGAILAVMTVTVMAQIISRYGFNASLSWTEELSKTLMVWSAFLVAPWAYRHGANVSIDIFYDALPQAVRTFASLVINLLVLWIVAVFFFEGIEFAERGFKSQAASLPVRTGVFYLIVPASFAALFLVGVELLIRNTLSLFGIDAALRDHVSRREA